MEYQGLTELFVAKSDKVFYRKGMMGMGKNADGLQQGKTLKHKRHNTIMNCRIFPDIHEQLVHCVPVEKVVQNIHERGELKHIKANSLRRLLQRYLVDIPPGEIVAKKQPLIVLRALERLEPVIESLKKMQQYIDLLEARVLEGWNYFVGAEAEMKERINNEPDPEYALELAANLYGKFEKVKKDTAELVDLRCKMIAAQADAGIIQRNLGQLDINVMKYETSIREIAKTSKMDEGKIATLLKNPQSMYKVLDFVKAVRNADPAVIDLLVKADRKKLMEEVDGKAAPAKKKS